MTMGFGYLGPGEDDDVREPGPDEEPDDDGPSGPC
jgi:hypothetical protein